LADWLRQFLVAPEYPEDPERTAIGRLFHIAAMVLITASLVATVSNLLAGEVRVALIMIAAIVLMFGMIVAARRGYLRLASVALPSRSPVPHAAPPFRSPGALHGQFEAHPIAGEVPGSMIEINGVAHVILSVSEWPACRQFYERLLAFLGLTQAFAGEEMIYYVSGNFGSRKGISVGSITLHPSGLPHGPQPGLAERSLGVAETTELAVMLDCTSRLEHTENAVSVEDASYHASFQSE